MGGLGICAVRQSELDTMRPFPGTVFEVSDHFAPRSRPTAVLDTMQTSNVTGERVLSTMLGQSSLHAIRIISLSFFGYDKNRHVQIFLKNGLADIIYP